MNTKQMEAVVKLAVETALEHMEKDKLKKHKERRDRRLRNTKLLLRNYRNLVIHCQDIKLELSGIDDVLLMEELDGEDLALEAIKRSKQRTLAVVQFIQNMLDIYKLICERSNRPEDIRRYSVIKKMYIDEPRTTVENIAECHSVEKRTIFRDVEKACKDLSGLLFGVDSIQF
ncbi:hypothetical protein [Bacillus sp. B-jedd]|uniref:hypothetical protein n=1 Tax=Bacillus sp. B-jedd TaxID=1476857 RepID=UPI0005156415|nr:hypothetical protein [Bacillus sp. B-jedd]CEG25997.1 hypothetical protein BN1002_00835 [Bacillus sp. B-jedd]